MGSPGWQPQTYLDQTATTQEDLEALVELDVHPRVAMQILRHAKIATTMDIYSHVPTAATRVAMDNLSRHLA